MLLIPATLSSAASVEVLCAREEPENMAEVLLRQNLVLPSHHFQLLILLIQQSEERVMLLTKTFDLITKEILVASTQ